MKISGHNFTRLLVALPVCLLASLASAQQDFSAVQIVPHQVAGNIYYLQGQGGNIGVSIGADGVVMIDDQFAPLTDKILAAIRTLSSGDIRFLINTHIHGDHTGGNENLGKMGILILARDEVRVRLSATAAPEALPVLTFSEDMTVHLNGEDMHIISVPPAHTDGDAIIYFQGSDVIHVGDVFRTTGFPYMDLANGGSLQGTLDALAMIIGMAGPNTKIIPGHGGVSSREDVREFRDMILDVASKVKALVEQGRNLEQVIAARPTAAYAAKWTDDPSRFLGGVYAGVGGQ